MTDAELCLDKREAIKVFAGQGKQLILTYIRLDEDEKLHVSVNLGDAFRDTVQIEVVRGKIISIKRDGETLESPERL